MSLETAYPLIFSTIDAYLKTNKASLYGSAISDDGQFRLEIPYFKDLQGLPLIFTYPGFEWDMITPITIAGDEWGIVVNIHVVSQTEDLAAAEWDHIKLGLSIHDVLMGIRPGTVENAWRELQLARHLIGAAAEPPSIPTSATPETYMWSWLVYVATKKITYS